MKNRILLYIGFILVMLPNSSDLLAFVRLQNIFSDNMVLQQGMPVRVWGWADPGENVSITFTNQNKTVVTDKKSN